MKGVIFVVLIFSLVNVYSQHRNKALVSDKAEAAGFWKSIGDGYLLKVESGTITLYSYTSRFCYEEQNAYLTDLLNNTSRVFLSPGRDTLLVYLHDFGSRTKTLQAEKRFLKISSLPENCVSAKEKELNDPEYLFELFFSTLMENYAYAKERNLDWTTIYSSYRPKITSTTTPNELFSVMGEIVTLTRDQHTKIISKEEGTRQYSGVPSALLLGEVFREQDSVKNFNEYISSFFKANYDNITDDLLQGKGKKVANGKIEWGDVAPDIGYIHLHSLTGFASNSLPRSQHIDTLNFYMEQIMRSFQRKKAIIIDVSFNFGGYDAAGLCISAYFTERPTPVYTKFIYQDGSFYKGKKFIVNPSAQYRFTKPVYLVTSDITRSAAETFAMQMKALPNVKLAGTNTLGITSDMLGKSIGEYYLTLSNEKYLTPAGEMYEVKGVDVDIPIVLFSKENMFNGHRDAVRKVIKVIEQN